MRDNRAKNAGIRGRFDIGSGSSPRAGTGPAERHEKAESEAVYLREIADGLEARLVAGQN